MRAPARPEVDTCAPARRARPSFTALRPKRAGEYWPAGNSRCTSACFLPRTSDGHAKCAGTVDDELRSRTRGGSLCVVDLTTCTGNMFPENSLANVSSLVLRLPLAALDRRLRRAPVRQRVELVPYELDLRHQRCLRIGVRRETDRRPAREGASVSKNERGPAGRTSAPSRGAGPPERRL